MVFKGRFFSSKKSDSSSPDGSNSPRSFGSNSPIRSDKKKVKSTKEDSQTAGATTSNSSSSTSFGVSCRQTQVKVGSKSKDVKGKEAQRSHPHTPAKLSSVVTGSKLQKPSDGKELASSVSPILASSLGLNRIKTRSGPLPQESFFGFRGDKGLGLGASNLSRSGADGGSGLESVGNKGKKKEVLKQTRNVVQENARNSDSISSGCAQSRDQSPIVPAPSRFQNGESSAEMAGMYQLQLLSVESIFKFVFIFVIYMVI